MSIKPLPSTITIMGVRMAQKSCLKRRARLSLLQVKNLARSDKQMNLGQRPRDRLSLSCPPSSNCLCLFCGTQSNGDTL